MRFEFWEKRLNAVVDQYSRMPFEWGRRDCVLFAADAAWCLTQKDPAAPWRRTYHDEAGAAVILFSFGGLEALVEKTMAAAGTPVQRIEPAFGQRGDPCLFDGPRGPSLGVILGKEFAAKNTEGLARLPIAEARIAWAIR